MRKKLIYCLIGIVLFTNITVLAATLIDSKDVTYSPKNEAFEVQNVKDAIDFLYENAFLDGGELSYRYHNMIISLDPTTMQLKYEYEGKQIYPVYWYGYMPSTFYTGNIGLNPWYETNAWTGFSYNAESVTVNRTVSATNRTCVGGFTTPWAINLAGYSKFHVLVNSTTTDAELHLAGRTGYVGDDLSNEGSGLAWFGVSSATQHITADISGVSGTYYLGLRSWCKNGSIDIAAIWLE